MTKAEIVYDMLTAYDDGDMGDALDVARAAVVKQIVEIIDDMGPPNHTHIDREKTRAAVLALLEPAKQAEVA